MTIHVALNHRTVYRYDREVSLSPQLVRLKPAPHCRTPVLSYSLKMKPSEHFINWQQDPQSNHVARIVFPGKVSELSIEVDLVAEMTVINPFDFFVEPYATAFPFVYEDSLARDLKPYLDVADPGPLVADYASRIPTSAPSTVDFLVALNREIQSRIKYLIRMEPGVQNPEETLRIARGSCRDTAWLLVNILRRIGLAARFVSGYLIQLAPDEKPLDGPVGPANDFTDLHAWAEAYLPGAGWIGLDPTSGLFAGEGHLPLAATPEPSSAAPLTGTSDEAKVTFDFSMTVRRIHEDPRVTKPYRDETWNDVLELGAQVEDELRENDVRLSMGGEPTFVSVDNMDGIEWNFTALGTEKLRLAEDLLRRLKRRFAPGGFLHFGQGKWYPGEGLPRWAMACYWRDDGVPVWSDDQWLAIESHDRGANASIAEKFARELARSFSFEDEFVLPAHEDEWYRQWRSRQIPPNIDPLHPPARAPAIDRIVTTATEVATGFVLPIHRDERTRRGEWITGPWYFRHGHLFLSPGDSPMGYRLPLDSLPWIRPEDYPYIHARDPLDKREPLGKRRTRSRKATALPTDVPDVRTAICVEPRGGILHIFLPPVRDLEDYLDLIARVESAARKLKIPVRPEGYPPPSDHRIKVFKVTPDPGVIEVNIQPSASWNELVDNTTILYEESREARLGAEKFMLDGRHTGTGGGNHVIMGASDPSESPIFRRPDLLRSLISYWNNHPSLSYLFSGLFIGPTSQAPRVDESRHDRLFELEIAFEQIPINEDVQPWLVDRVFRHLLTDATGNTHRSEFCIDKLYNPDSAAGRHGLVELRAFEMPPHPRMSLMQMLLLRALIARFWQAPYNEKLIRWGTQLHDRFMLPYFVRLDFRSVVDDLKRAGYPFRHDWFDPFVEFRFPAYGSVAYRGVRMELRQALEPWHVLGEESGDTGQQTRYVDSSVERLQVKVTGATGDRYVATCNGRKIPLHPTGVAGELVAGVRFRAWQPPKCLHPTIKVQTPLVFDIVDQWNGRSIGGCRYHVAHPGGRNYETFPVNSYEAEARRAARFFTYGHSAGPLEVADEEINPDFPFTLDLRRAGGDL